MRNSAECANSVGHAWTLRLAESDPLVAAETITITRAALADEAGRALITELNAELSGTYPEPGANHFGLDPEEVAPGRAGAWRVRAVASTRHR